MKQLGGRVEMLLMGYGVTVYRGWASVPALGKVEVKHEDGSVESLRPSTSSCNGNDAAASPGFQGEHRPLHSSDDALESTMCPSVCWSSARRLGVEFACLWNAFGSKETWLRVRR